MSLIETVKDAGIVGAGGAGFPTHVKLNTKAEYFIVNAAECEPLIETDKYLCRTFADELIKGIMYISQHLEAKKSYIALKAKYKAEIAALEEAIQKNNADIEIFAMRTFYPAGDEQIIVEQITGRTVPERGIPIEVGAVVDNVGTVISIYEAMAEGTKVTDKYLSVVGEVAEPIMLKVPIGTSVRTCIEAASPKISDYAIILGGPMMGRVFSDNGLISQQVVTKTTGNIIVLPKDHYLVKRTEVSIERIKHQARSACIQCRMCTDLCPRFQIGHSMRPHLVMRNIWREDGLDSNEEFAKCFGEAVNCSSCGVCEMFSCPMGLSPRQVNNYMKVKLRERGITIDKTPNPTARPTIDLNRIPTDRLIARLGLNQYNGLHAHTCTELFPGEVFIPLAQHIGKPAELAVKAGDTVHKGDVIGQAAEGGLSANIHASADGTVTEATPAGVRINVN
ncbi:4Fe-4S dicluster domain-containing protein [Luxibacter massiliensis]|uniref:4Fe-4S dicluster domain-containing protein n=1 Tax=Luxibacter massiliensis TaxID=2219695 RepID=UPI000F046ED6|nr:4Fe-4S dicluster domain-containing protein [Luxibacter massiliensis]